MCGFRHYVPSFSSNNQMKLCLIIINLLPFHHLTLSVLYIPIYYHLSRLLNQFPISLSFSASIKEENCCYILACLMASCSHFRPHLNIGMLSVLYLLANFYSHVLGQKKYFWQKKKFGQTGYYIPVHIIGTTQLRIVRLNY